MTETKSPQQTKSTKDSCESNAVFMQCSLAIGAVNDPMEHEADALADKVMRMQNVPTATAHVNNNIQRKCASCEEEKIQQKPLSSFIQRKESTTEGMASNAASNKINATKGNGSTLDSSTQSFMQSRFNTDFNAVKIHTDNEAIQMNRELNAKAFTVGNDIYFNAGQYNPNSYEGKHLLAHELTHTLQQGGMIQRRPISNRPPWSSIPIDTELIQDPVERMEFLRTQYEMYIWKSIMERYPLGELNDNDLKNSRLRNRLAGLKRSEVTDLIAKIKAHQIQRDKDVANPAVKDATKKIPITTTKIIEWLEVRQTISTPMPENAVVNSSLLGSIDSYSVQLKDILITVMPDTHGASSNETGPSSNFEGRFAWREVSGKITDLKKDGVAFNPTQLEVKIQTKYKLDPDVTSGYGRGTTADDKSEGTTTLRVHEGQHGTDFIDYLSRTPLPVVLASGINGNLTPAQFTLLLKYIQNITSTTCEATDQIGFSQDEFLKTKDGKASGILSCRKP